MNSSFRPLGHVITTRSTRSGIAHPSEAGAAVQDGKRGHLSTAGAGSSNRCWHREVLRRVPCLPQVLPRVGDSGRAQSASGAGSSRSPPLRRGHGTLFPVLRQALVLLDLPAGVRLQPQGVGARLRRIRDQAVPDGAHAGATAAGGSGLSAPGALVSNAQTVTLFRRSEKHERDVTVMPVK